MSKLLLKNLAMLVHIEELKEGRRGLIRILRTKAKAPEDRKDQGDDMIEDPNTDNPCAIEIAVTEERWRAMVHQSPSQQAWQAGVIRIRPCFKRMSVVKISVLMAGRMHGALTTSILGTSEEQWNVSHQGREAPDRSAGSREGPEIEPAQMTDVPIPSAIG